MTEQTQDVSEFSFRTFDIYRRFVEVLQCKPSYLKEFKTGSPTEETCHALIKKVFQSQQEDAEIKKYTQYFAIHAKMMAGHAENLPDNWNDAIDYTNRYIKEIRKYLRKKGISVRSDLARVDEIAKDIGKYIHDKPTVKQVEAIQYYLKYDLRNPKRNLISPNSPKKSKSKSHKASRQLEKSQMTNDKVVEEQQVVQKQNDPLSSACELSTQEAAHFLQINSEKDYYEDEEEEPSPPFESIETEIVDDLFETVDTSIPVYEESINDCDIFNYGAGNAMSPKLSSPSNSYVKMNNNTEANRVEETGVTVEPYKAVNKDSNNFHLKRKSSSPLEHDHYYGLKKQLQMCRRIPKNVPQKPIINTIQAVHVKSSSDISSDTENEQTRRYFMINQYEESNESEGKASFDSEMSEQMKNSIFNLKSQARDMSYADAVKHIDLATTFCELKNAISKEELLIMQQIREKMYFESLNEQNTM